MSTENTPKLWQHYISAPSIKHHKHSRGASVICGGGIECTGATRMAAMAALRIGAGLVTVACDDKSLPIYASQLTAVMTKTIKNQEALSNLLQKKSSVLIGPGYGVGKKTKKSVLHILEESIPCVLDADALTSFEKKETLLFNAIHQQTIITPHEGEFSRLFGRIEGSREDAALAAAKQSGAIVVLKGNHTLIASPEGQIVINKNASPWLATAGSGDVLAGIITGLLAQHLPVFEAACAGVWFHGECSQTAGVGLIAEDLIPAIPNVLETFLSSKTTLERS
jgi:NAD(P)H-hydrate epimerase